MCSKASTPKLLVNDETLNNSSKTFTVPDGEVWEIESIWAQLSTTAFAGNRSVLLQVAVPATPAGAAKTVYEVVCPVTQAATLTQQYCYVTSGVKDTAFVGTRILLPLPAELELPAGSTIKVFDAAAIDAAADDLTVNIFGETREA